MATNSFPYYLEDIIEAYSRKQAIADGLLVDISKTAAEAGFKFPVAITNAAWSDYVEWNEQDSKRQTHQSTDGRLWDILWMLRLAIQRHHRTNEVSCSLNIVPRDGKTCQTQCVTLKAVLSCGDDGEPVITVMLPHED